MSRLLSLWIGLWFIAFVTCAPDARAGSWTSIGPSGGGWLTSAAVSTTGVIYAGCDVGGVYRSTNNGLTWTIINNGLLDYSVNAIVVDPIVPNTVYLGTNGGMYQSLDGGNSWTALRNGFPALNPDAYSAPIATIALDPNSHLTVYAGIGDSRHDLYGQGKIYKSINGGLSWSIVNTGSSKISTTAIIYGIAVDPTSSSIVYASTDKGVYRSADGGVNWAAKNSGLGSSTNTRKIAIDATTHTTLYLTDFAKSGSVKSKVFKSTNSGTSWSAVLTGSVLGATGDDLRLSSEFKELIVDHRNPGTLYVGDYSWVTPTVWKSTNSGSSWTDTSGGLHLGQWGQYVGYMVYGMAIDPSNSNLYSTTSMEIYQSTDAGSNWYEIYNDENPVGSGYYLGRGMNTAETWTLAVDPTNANKVYAGFWDIGFEKSTNGGSTWKRTGASLSVGDNFTALAVDPGNTSVIYAGTGGDNQGGVSQLVKSADAGETWTALGNLPTSYQINAVAIDTTTPLSSRTLYVALYGGGVYKSTNGGTSFSAVNSGLSTGNRYTSSLVISSTNHLILYAGFDMENTGNAGGVYKTTTGGTSWSRSSGSPYSIKGLAIDTLNPQNVFAAVRDTGSSDGGLYRSQDGGATWSQRFWDLYMKSVAVDPTNSSKVYAGSSEDPYYDQASGSGFYQSTDGGTTWQSANTGLNNLGVLNIVVAPSAPTVLYLGSTGSGLFKGSF
jgi:photosystem II stability/assembly factor-like uncharacterized protein